MLHYGTDIHDEKPQSYKQYKTNAFEKRKTKIRSILSGVSDTSLKPEDKANLIAQIKEIVAKF